MGAALRNEWDEGIQGLLISSESLTFQLCPPPSLGGSEARCKTLADVWPFWLIVCVGLMGVSLAPGICQECIVCRCMLAGNAVPQACQSPDEHWKES